MAILTNSEHTIQSVRLHINDRSEAKFSSEWRDPKTCNDKLKSINDTQRKINSFYENQDYTDLKDTEHDLANWTPEEWEENKYRFAPNPGPYGWAGRDWWYDGITQQEALAYVQLDLEKFEEQKKQLERSLQQQVQDARENIPLKVSDGGTYYANLELQNQDGKTFENVPLDGSWTEADFDHYKNVTVRTYYTYTQPQVNLINYIIDLINAGEEVPNEYWEALFYYGHDFQGDVFNRLQNAVLDNNFRYNIKRNFNEKLIDIRNVKNFRASNLQDKAKLNAARTHNRQYINATTADGTNASKSFYMSRNDFYWSQNFRDVLDEDGRIAKQSIQNIILNEYQPSLQYNIGLEIFSHLDTEGGKLVDKAGEKLQEKMGRFGKIGMGIISSAAEHLIEKFYNDRLDYLSEFPQQLYGEEHYEDFSNPMYYIEHLFNNGKWLNTYELPFIENEKVKTDYLKNSDDSGTWSIGGLTDCIDQNGQSFTQKILHNRISLSLPTTPVFNLNNPHNASLGPINIDFYLINKDDFYLDKNFQFMQAIFAGTQWLSMDIGTIIATNVYHVLVPGRFVIQWAALQSEFQAIGKLRTNDHMYAMYGKENGSINQIGMIQADTLWPEAWHIKLTIKPLTPWNFNTHMAYYLNGFNYSQQKRLNQMKTAWWNTAIPLDGKNEEERQNQFRSRYREAIKPITDKLDYYKDKIIQADASGEGIDINDVIAYQDLLEQLDKINSDFTDEERKYAELASRLGLGDVETLMTQTGMRGTSNTQYYKHVGDHLKELRQDITSPDDKVGFRAQTRVIMRAQTAEENARMFETWIKDGGDRPRGFSRGDLTTEMQHARQQGLITPAEYKRLNLENMALNYQEVHEQQAREAVSKNPNRQVTEENINEMTKKIYESQHYLAEQGAEGRGMITEGEARRRATELLNRVSTESPRASKGLTLDMPE